jgi:hypothetical protein
MSNNLDLDQVSENQALKEVTINTATGQLDAALTEALSVSLAAGNASLTNSQYRRNFAFVATGVATSGRTITLPTIKKLAAIKSDAANTNSIDIVKGSTTFALAPGSVILVYTDGTANGLDIISESAAGAAKIYDIATYCAGKPDASERLLRFAFVRSIDFPANLTGSQVLARVAATAQTDFELNKNGSSIGTVRFAIAGTTATFIGVGAESFVAGDILELVAPASQDATLADISFSFAGEQA